MAVENTDFKVFNSVHNSSGIGDNIIDILNNVAGGGSAQTIGGIGPPQELIVDYSADQFNIPEGSTIVGFRTRIQADGNLNQTDVNVEYTFAGSYDPTHDAASFNGPINTRVISTDSLATYIDGYNMDSDNNYLNDGVLNVWNTHGLARLRIRFLNSDPGENDGFMAVRFDSDSIGLQIFYEAPTPTKVKLEGKSSTATAKSLRSSETVNTTFGVGGAANRLTTTNTPGTITINNNDVNIFIGGVIGVRFNQVEDLNGSTFNLSDVWDSVTNIRTRFIYSWNSSLADNSNSFKIGWTGEADSSNANSLYNIVYNEETIFNTEDNHDVPKLYTSNINGSTLATLKQSAAGDLTKLRFIFRYNDDSPDNAVILYGQGLDGGAVPAGDSLENQASLEFRVTYNTTPINYKVKIQHDSKTKIQSI
jgi:hypothetical protein